MKKSEIQAKEKLIIENFSKVFNSIKRIDENEVAMKEGFFGDNEEYADLTPEQPQRNQYAEEINSLVEKIIGLTKDDFGGEPDEYGMTTSPILSSYMNWMEPEFDETYNKITHFGKIKGFKPFMERLSHLLGNYDIIAIDQGGKVNVQQSNNPKVAQLYIKLTQM